MKSSNVVQLPNRHRDMSRGDGMELITYQLGSTVVRIDDYFIRNQSAEEKNERDEQIGLLAYEIEQRIQGETA